MASSKTARELGDRLADLSRGKRPRDEYAIYVSHMIDRALEEERAAVAQLVSAVGEILYSPAEFEDERIAWTPRQVNNAEWAALKTALARVKEFLP